MPDLVGLDGGEAQRALTVAGLTWAWSSPEVMRSSAPIDEWVITGQEPAAGADVAAKRTVLLDAEQGEPKPAPTPTTSSASAFTAEEQAYLDARQAAGDIFHDGEAAAIRVGRAYCARLKGLYGGDPAAAVPALIEDGLFRNEAAIATLCPEFSDALAIALTGFSDGNYRVVDNPAADGEIAAGTYRTIVTPGSRGTSDCYWERTTGGGGTIANDFVSLAPNGVTVTVRSGEGFVSQGCGNWVPAP